MKREFIKSLLKNGLIIITAILGILALEKKTAEVTTLKAQVESYKAAFDTCNRERSLETLEAITRTKKEK